MREAGERWQARVQKRDEDNEVVTDQLTEGRQRNHCAETDMEIDRITRINNFKCRQLVRSTERPRGRQLQTHNRRGQ